MKRSITMFIVLAMIACLMSGLTISAYAAAPAITIDGDISDWAGLRTIETVAGDAKYTFYGVVADDGLYIACDAYTVGFDPGTGNWWDAPNLEFFVGPYRGDENQRWVSFTDKSGGFVKEGNITTAAVSYEAVEGAATNHAIAEAFIAKNQLNDAWFYADGSIRVGMAFDTNNSEPGGAYVNPTGTTEREVRALVTNDGICPMLPSRVTVTTADELISFIKTVNDVVRIDDIATKLTTLSIANDIDLTGKEWAPLNKWIGVIEGNGHTISGITYETDAETGNFGLLVNDLTNYNAYGTVQNLTIKNSAVIAKNTNGYVGGVAGYADRGRVMNCTVDNTAVIGNGVSGGIVGGACWATGWDGQWVIEIINDTVKDSVIAAVDAENGKAGGIAGINYWDDLISIGNYTIDNVTIIGNTANAAVADAQGRTPVQGAGASVTGVTTGDTVTAPALVSGQNAAEWDSQDPEAVSIGVTAVVNTLSAVKVNGRSLRPSDYSVSATDNGFDVTLSVAYLKTLEDGSYKIVIETYLGNVPEVTLNVKAGASVPPTGDATVTAAFAATIAIILLSAAMAARKRRHMK